MMKAITTLADFPIPANSELEILMLAELITFPAQIAEAQAILNTEMFTSEERKNIWIALTNMYNAGESIDFTTMFVRCERSVMQREILPALSKIGSGMAIKEHCYLLRDISAKRKAYMAALSLLQLSSSHTSTLQDTLRIPNELVENINADYKSDRCTERITTSINELASEIEKNQCDRSQGKRIRIPTGFDFLDRLTYSGFNAGQLIILAARPSVGKTAIMLQMAKEAVNFGFPATIFSLEMTNTELAQRLLFSTGTLKPMQIYSSDVQWEAFEDAANHFSTAPLYLNDKSRTLDDIIANILLNHNQGKCDIAFIDYLGLIQHSNTRQPLYQIIAEITKKLKQVAKDCRIPIVLLCQLNRASASESRAPELFDLRDSGSIEQDADIVLMLEKNTETSDSETTEVNMWVRKNRQGKAGDIAIRLRPNSTFTAFTEVELMQLK